jgi:Fe-S oxidoreductase
VVAQGTNTDRRAPERPGIDHGQEEDDPHHPAGAHADARAGPQARIKNFDEVACGYRLEDALLEAERCLDCADQPCVRGCPVGIDIPGFIQKMAEELPRRLRRHHRHQPAAFGVRPRLPAGKPVRGRVHRR